MPSAGIGRACQRMRSFRLILEYVPKYPDPMIPLQIFALMDRQIMAFRAS